MAKRETSTDLRNKHTDAISKLKGLQSRIQQRAKEMSDKQPEIIYGYDAHERTPVTVKQWYDEFDLYIRANNNPDMQFATEVFLKIIQKIEKHNEKNSPYVQGKMFDQNKEEEVTPAMDKVIQALREGKLLMAVKIYKESTGKGLKESKDYVCDVLKPKYYIVPGKYGKY